MRDRTLMGWISESPEALAAAALGVKARILAASCDGDGRMISYAAPGRIAPVAGLVLRLGPTWLSFDADFVPEDTPLPLDLSLVGDDMPSLLAAMWSGAFSVLLNGRKVGLGFDRTHVPQHVPAPSTSAAPRRRPQACLGLCLSLAARPGEVNSLRVSLGPALAAAAA